jgi:hypothetical protein
MCVKADGCDEAAGAPRCAPPVCCWSCTCVLSVAFDGPSLPCHPPASSRRPSLSVSHAHHRTIDACLPCICTELFCLTRARATLTLVVVAQRVSCKNRRLPARVALWLCGCVCGGGGGKYVGGGGLEAIGDSVKQALQQPVASQTAHVVVIFSWCWRITPAKCSEWCGAKHAPHFRIPAVIVSPQHTPECRGNLCRRSRTLQTLFAAAAHHAGATQRTQQSPPAQSRSGVAAARPRSRTSPFRCTAPTW